MHNIYILISIFINSHSTIDMQTYKYINIYFYIYMFIHLLFYIFQVHKYKNIFKHIDILVKKYRCINE